MCAGRRAGKSELALYMIVRWAITNPGSANYYIGPFKTQTAEIIWHSRRLHNMIPAEYIDTVSRTEYRITLKNGSFIKVSGSDDADSLRGIRINFLVADEIKDWREDSYHNLLPACADYNAPIFTIGTPPVAEGLFTKLMDDHIKDPEMAFYEMPTTENPHINKEWIEKERIRLYDRGDGDIFEREYMAKFVRGGKSKIFPQLDASLKSDQPSLLHRISKDINQLEYYCAMDPGSSSVFAVLFVAYNYYRKRLYILDELYITEQSSTSIGKVMPLVLDTIKKWYPTMDEWRFICDEAATWARNEILDRYGLFVEPTDKVTNKKEFGISIIKDILHQKRVLISKDCTKLYWEMDNYVLDKNGSIPKRDDHLIDCLRYTLGACKYDSHEGTPPSMLEQDLTNEERRDNAIKEYVIPREPYLFEMDEE